MNDARFVKFVVLVNGLVPGTLLAWDCLHGQGGADPVHYALLTTGMLALIFLCLSLLVTPLRQITGIGWLFYSRRALGLYAFFYALAHFSIYIALDRNWDIADTVEEMLWRRYLVVGLIALLCLAPLAATSFNAAIRWMGSKRWQALHRLAYVAAIAAVLHYYMQVKADIRKPIAFFIAVAILLGYRVGAFIVKESRRKPQAPRGFPVEPVTAPTVPTDDKATGSTSWKETN